MVKYTFQYLKLVFILKPNFCFCFFGTSRNTQLNVLSFKETRRGRGRLCKFRWEHRTLKQWQWIWRKTIIWRWKEITTTVLSRISLQIWIWVRRKLNLRALLPRTSKTAHKFFSESSQKAKKSMPSNFSKKNPQRKTWCPVCFWILNVRLDVRSFFLEYSRLIN